MANNTVLTTPNTEALNRPLVSPGDKGEPAHEWASSTLQALSPTASKAHLADEQPHTTHADSTTTNTAFTNADAPSTATTPGVSIPGAFPREEELLETSSKTGSSSIGEEAQYVKDVAASALETAKEYVLSTTEQVGSRVGELLHENVAPYLPPSLHPPHDTTTKNTSPSIDTAPNPDDVTLEGVPTPPSPEVPSQQSKSETMREGMGSGNPGSLLSAPSHKDPSASAGGASADASIRSLAGSKAVGGDRKSVNTVNESDSYSFTAAPSVADHPELKAENVSKPSSDPSNNPAGEQDRPNLPHHSNATRHIPPVSSTDPNSGSGSGSGATMPNVNARDYPVGTVDARHVGFTHKNSSRDVGSSISNVATPGHGDVDRDAAKGAAPFMPPGVPQPANSKEQDLLRGTGTGTMSTSHSGDDDKTTTNADKPQDDALSRAGNHAVTASSGITAADLAQTGAASAMAGGAGMTTAVPSSPTPPVPPKDYEGQNNKDFAHGGKKASPTATGTGTTTAKPTTDLEHKADVPSQPAAGRAPPAHQSESPASSKSGSGAGNSTAAGNGGGKTKSGFMDKLKGEMKVLTGKLEHKQEKVEEGRKMMGKGSRN